MLLSDIFEILPYGELSNLFSSGSSEGSIKQKDYPKVIANINMGLIELHKRFPILTKQVNIQLFEHISLYKLDRVHAQSNTESTAVKYIMDSEYYPFNNDLIQIKSVINEDDCSYPLNVPSDPFSLFTPSYNVLQVPYPLSENALAIEYQAYPTKIPLTTDKPSQVFVELPEFMLEALNTYICYKFYAGVGIDKPEAINYLKKFDIECKRITDLGVYNLDMEENLKLESNQWV